MALLKAHLDTAMFPEETLLGDISLYTLLSEQMLPWGEVCREKYWQANIAVYKCTFTKKCDAF